MVAIKMKGLEYSVGFQDIKNFFYGSGYVKNSVQIGLNREGKSNGFGAILMSNEDAAAKCVDEK